MKVAIAGGHGKIGIRLARLLTERGDEVRSLIRDPERADDIRATGAEAVVCDLESGTDARIAEGVGSVDAVVFAAGAGPGSGTERKETVDYGGAVKLIDAAKANGVSRYVMVSSIGADPPPRATTPSVSTCAPRGGLTPSWLPAGWPTRSCGRRG